MIVVDASAMPDFASGARTRLRGLAGALALAPPELPVALLVARGSTLLDSLDLRALERVEVEPPGGPWRRALARGVGGARVPASVARRARVWHSETIPPLAPAGVAALLTLHDLRWNEPRAESGAPLHHWWPRHLAARCWLPRVARRAAGIVTVSEASRRAIERALHVAPERIHLIPNATLCSGEPVAPAPFAPLAAQWGLEDATPFFVALGRLEPRKGLDLALAALARAGGAGAAARLVVVGEGPQRVALEEQARALHLAPRVRFAGRLADLEVAALLDHAAALLFPSRHEGFGLPVFEALARGCHVVARPLPVFARFAPVAADALGRDARAALVRAESEAAWTQAIEALAAAPPRRAPRVACALPERSTWRDAAAALAALWERTAAACAPGGGAAAT